MTPPGFHPALGVCLPTATVAIMKNRQQFRPSYELLEDRSLASAGPWSLPSLHPSAQRHPVADHPHQRGHHPSVHHGHGVLLIPIAILVREGYLPFYGGYYGAPWYDYPGYSSYGYGGCACFDTGFGGFDGGGF